jgi:hypothetical protein
MSSTVENLVALPKLIFATLGTGAVTVASGALEAAKAPEVHWAQILVWVFTALAALATVIAGLTNTYITISKFVTGRRARARAKKRYYDKQKEQELETPEVDFDV